MKGVFYIVENNLQIPEVYLKHSGMNAQSSGDESSSLRFNFIYSLPDH